MKQKAAFRWIAPLIPLILVGAALAPVSAVARFGTACQRDFQNSWQVTLPEVWTRCSWFNDELDSTDTKVFYYNLRGGKWWWEDSGDEWGLDTVHLVYANTHGGAWTDRSVWTMWDQNSYADSTAMRLGDESYGTNVFATYACKTLKFNDSKMWVRMGAIFRGGLRYATGSHDLVYDSTTTNEVGEDFADDLQDGKSIKFAWRDGNSDWYVDQDLTVMSTGRWASDCYNRRDNMKWQTLYAYGTLADSQIQYYCYYYWDNL